MVKKYKEPPQPSAWRLALDCLHSPIMSNQEIQNSLVDSKYRMDGTTQGTIVCPLCARHAPGSCDKGNIIHRVGDMTPLYSRQMKEEEHDEQHQ